MRSSHTFKLALVLEVVLSLGCRDSAGKLIAQLDDADPKIRRIAARAIGDLPGQAGEVVAALSEAIHDPDTEVRESAISALGRIGSAAASSLPALELALDDPQLSVRLAAALAIQKIDSRSQSCVPVILESLRAGHGPVFLAVGRMGANAEWAVPMLVELLSDRRISIRALAAQTLGQIGTVAGDAKSALERSLRDENPAVRKAAQHALEQIE